MGKKGGSTSVQNYERPLSQQELQLLETQNQMLQAGIGISQEQEARSADQYKQWQNTYEPIETGLLSPTASRANGYYNDPNVVTRQQYNNRKNTLNQNQQKLKNTNQYNYKTVTKRVQNPAPTTKPKGG